MRCFKRVHYKILRIGRLRLLRGCKNNNCIGKMRLHARFNYGRYTPNDLQLYRNAIRSAIRLSLSAYARLRDAPSLVSTRIFSPSLMNAGTCTTRPVSVFAGLVTLDAVADFSPGSVSTT